jgi:hypothetical protein
MKRLGISFGSDEPQEPYPLPCLNLITLSRISFPCYSSSVLLAFGSQLLRTLARHHLTTQLLAYQYQQERRGKLAEGSQEGEGEG